MHIFLDNFHQGGKYCFRIASHQAELRREGNFTDQKFLSIVSLHTDFLILTAYQVVVKMVREKILYRQSVIFVEVLTILQIFSKRIRKEKGKSRVAGDLDNRRTEHTPRKCFRYGSEDHLIAKFLKPPKDNNKQQNQVCFSERANRSSQKECDNRKNSNVQNIYASMERMSNNYECLSRDFGESSQRTNCILDSGATCHMTPQVLDFIPSLLEDTDKNIEAAGGHHVMEKQKGQVQIKCATIT